MNLGDVWGVKPKRQPTKKKVKVDNESALWVIDQAAWLNLVTRVHEEFDRMTKAGMTTGIASRTLREYLGIKILPWDAVMTRLPVVPPELRHKVVDFEAKMRAFS